MFPRRILVVEDSSNLREDIVSILKFNGYEVEEAANGRLGLNAISKNLPDLIICDVTMPELDGFELLRCVRENSKTAYIPFIFLSARTLESNVRKGMELGADDYLSKPFQTNQLLQTIRARFERQKQIISVTASKESSEENPVDENYILQLINNQSRRPEPGGLLFLQLDRFDHYIQGILEMLEGPELISTHLKNSFEKSTDMIHMHSNIFIFYIYGNDAETVARTAISNLKKPLNAGKYPLRLTVFGGFIRFELEADFKEVVQSAYRAFLRARQTGVDLAVSSEEDKRFLEDQKVIRRDLPNALNRGEFHLYYQPQMDIRTGAITGVESLLRWIHPERGILSPAVFLSEVMKMGARNKLCEWIIEEAISMGIRTREKLNNPLITSINVTAEDLENPHLIDCMSMLMEKYKVPPDSIELELTEGTIMKNLDSSRSALECLHDMGIILAIDDFGSGYSSLAYLRHLPVDRLKIDRAFIQDLEKDRSAQRILAAILDLGKDLGLEIIAEGIETEGQLRIARDLGVDLAQGFLVARPMSEPSLLEFLRNHHTVQFDPA